MILVSFDELLLAMGGGNRESGSEKYLEIRTNLMRFFEWRGCSFPEDHADETINRMARKVGEGEEILNPPAYAMGVARLLLLEIIKGRQKEQSALTELGQAGEAYVESDSGEDRLECLRECLQTLSPDNRELMTFPSPGFAPPIWKPVFLATNTPSNSLGTAAVPALSVPT